MNAIRNARNIFVAMLLVLMIGVAQSQQTFSAFSADFKGTPEFFSVALTPPRECVGNLYVVASFSQLGSVAYTWQNRYVPYRGGEIPAFEGTANAAGTFFLVSGVNVRQSEGAELYAGCGTSTEEMFRNNRWGRILKVGAVWPPEQTYGVGTVFSPQRIADSASTLGDNGWNVSVLNGAVRFGQNGLKLRGYEGVATMSALYDDADGTSRFQFVHKDDGSFLHSERVMWFRFSSRIGAGVGTDDGVVLFFPGINASECGSQCFKYTTMAIMGTTYGVGVNCLDYPGLVLPSLPPPPPTTSPTEGGSD